MSPSEPRAPQPGPRGRVAACSRYLTRRGWVALTLLAVGAAGVALPLAWLLAGAGGWAPGSGLPLLVVGVALAAGIGAIAWGWRRVGESLASGTMIARMEKAAGLPAGRLQAQLELEDAPPEGVSTSLVGAGQAGIAHAMNRPAAELSGEGRVETGRLLRAGALLAGGMALVSLSLLAAAPNRAEVAWAGLVRPLATLNPPALPPLEVSPGDARVPRGEQVPVVIGATGRREVTLRFDAPGEPTGRLTLPVVEGRAVGTLPAVFGTTRYQVRGDDGALSPEFVLEPEDPLLFESFSLVIDYPEYTGLPPETRSLPPTSLVVPVGASLRFSGELAGRTDDLPEALVLVGSGEDPVDSSEVHLTLPLDGRNFEGRWTPRRSTAVTWEARGRVSEGYRLPGILEVEVVPDAPPMVSLSAQGGGSDPELTAALRLPLRIEAEDDWGLGWVELEIRVFPEGAPVVETSDRTLAEGSRRLLLEPVLDLAGWGLEPGTRIRIQARAGDRGAGPGIGESEPLELRVPTPAALRQEAREQISAAAASTEAIAERAARDLAQTEARARDQVAAGAAQAGGGASSDPAAGGATPGSGAQASFQDREALRETLDGEARLLREIEAIRASLERSANSVGAGSEERELRRTLADLEQRMSALGGEDAVARADARLEALDGEPLSGPEAAAAMLEAAERQAALTEQLEGLLDRLRETALAAEVDRAREDAALLTQDQEALARDARAPDPNPSNPPSTPPTPAEAEAREADRQARQEALAERARELEARVEALEARLREQGQDGASAAASQAADALDQAASAMTQATAPGAPSEVGDRSDAASEAARAAEAAMREAAAAARETRSRRIRELLASAAVQALGLSETLAETMAQALTGATPGGRAEPAYQGSAEAAEVAGAARDGTRNLARALGDGLLDQPDLARELSPRTGAALAALDRAAAAGARPELEEARQALQTLALAALDALARGAGDEEGGEGGGSSEQMMEALDSLADTQDELNRDAQAMGSEPGQAGAGGQEGMEALAAGQQAVASALAELGGQTGGERIAGNLEELRREAEALAQELAGSAQEGRPRAETFARQERLLERLLEAGRTLERDEPTQERRGTAAGPVDRPLIPALPPGLLDRSGVSLPSPEALARLSPAERRLVLEYFARLNRGGTP